MNTINKKEQTNGYPTETEIRNLIQEGNWEKIKEHISDKESGFFRNSDMSDEEKSFYRTLLQEIISLENISESLSDDLKQVISSLLTERNRKAFLNFTDASGNNLLHLCILKNKKEILSLLLEKIKGSDDFVKFLLFEENKQGSTSIELADNNPPFQQLIQEFIQNKYGSPILREYFEETLFTAVENNKQSVVKFLLDAGINPHCCNGKGQSLLDVAEEKGYTEIANLLKEKEVKNATFIHAFWEGFESGAACAVAATMACMLFVGGSNRCMCSVSSHSTTYKICTFCRCSSRSFYCFSCCNVFYIS